jgi:hypothetical protein
MKEACRALVAVEFLDTRDVMRLVRRSIDTVFIRHVPGIETLTIRDYGTTTNSNRTPHNNLSRACGLSAGASRERSPREARGG